MISIKGLRKIFTVDNKPITAVDNLSLTIQQGEIFGVIGYSGAGKSTFVRLLNRLEEPSSGEIVIDQQNITTLNDRQLRKARQSIGMIFQHFNLLWSRTVADNIAFPLEVAGIPKKQREQRVLELIQLVGLSGRENSYPSQLSGGQKQRVGIARALANNPKVLLCDEATSALDPETTDSILNLLVDINKKLNLTIILITHEMHVIQKICNRVAVMEAGKIIEAGDVIDVFTRPKQAVTKKFVEQLVSGEQEDQQIDHIIDKMNMGTVVLLHFVGDSANQALISKTAKAFSVDLNILQGNLVQTVQGAYGSLYVQIEGPDDEIDKSLQFLQERSVEVEVIKDDRKYSAQN